MYLKDDGGFIFNFVQQVLQPIPQAKSCVHEAEGVKGHQVSWQMRIGSAGLLHSFHHDDGGLSHCLSLVINAILIDSDFFFGHHSMFLLLLLIIIIIIIITYIYNALNDALSPFPFPLH